MPRFLALTVACAIFLVPVTGTTAHATPDNFTPGVGATFNNAVGTASAKRAIFTRLIRSINSTPRGADIQMLTWNFLSKEATDALLRAERRGVTVRVLIDKRNVTAIDNSPFARLKRGLRQGNNQRFPAQEPSWARTCQASCRGRGGSAHAKFFMFSRVGKASRVVMQGSANLTVASTDNQWNDVFTHKGNKGVWAYYDKVFDQAALDKPAGRGTYVNKAFAGFRLIMFPLVGRPDPVAGLLDQVRCRRATNTANGRTRIRIAPDVLRQARGMALGRKVRQLWLDGCDVRVGYTVVGKDVGKMMRAPSRRGPVPMRHLVRDYDGDGQFDKYFHMKAMTVVGNVGGDRSGWVTLNGSANWSSLAAASDENLGIYRSQRLTRRYEAWLNRWYDYFGSGSTSSTNLSARRTAAPSADQLIFGFGPDAVYEDGTPVPRATADALAEVVAD